jgi:GNAT superfamily N-acetyltransferase
MRTISLLKKTHSFEPFDCGIQALNIFLKKHALQSQASNISRTYILSEEEKIIGYYSLVYGSISPQEVSERIRKGAGSYHLPIILIARLAIDKLFQGKGFGKALLKDGLIRCSQASEIAGLRAVVVNAKDEKAKSFYEKFGFEASPFDEFHLFLLMKDLKKNFSII